MKVGLLDFSSPNVGYEDNEGKDLCGCCRTYYVVSPEELAEAKEAVSDLYEALKVVEQDGTVMKTTRIAVAEALAKVEGEEEHGTFVLGFEEKGESSCREHWLSTILGGGLNEIRIYR